MSSRDLGHLGRRSSREDRSFEDPYAADAKHRSDRTQNQRSPIPSPPPYPPPPLSEKHSKRKRRRRSRDRRSSSGGSYYEHDRSRRSRSVASDDSRRREERRLRRDRRGRRKRSRSSENQYESSRRMRDSRSPSRHRKRKRRRRRGSYSRSARRSRSSEDSRYRQEERRKRRKRRHRSRRSYSPPRRSESGHRVRQPVPRDAPPRAGVVSDDEEVVRQQQLPAPPRDQTEGTTRRDKKKRARSDSSSHDDTTGHFKGRPGTMIANRYRIEREVGLGTFGRVVECLDRKRYSQGEPLASSKVAIKIVRKVKRYYESALIEAEIVKKINRRGGRGLSHCAIMHDAFTFSGHYCMVFETLGPSLYDFQKRHNYQPFPLMCVYDFAKQLLETLEFLHSCGLIHTDLKTENILLWSGREVNYRGNSIPESTKIKIIDFGGATYDNEKKSSVVNTRQYRAPEVILGLGWSMPSDLWSAGSILGELYQGELLFATHDNVEHLALIEQVVGPFPRRMLKNAKNADLVKEAFDSSGVHRMGRVLSPESFAYVRRVDTLEAMTRGRETWFLRLLRRLLVIDPDERATASEALRKLDRDHAPSREHRSRI